MAVHRKPGMKSAMEALDLIGNTRVDGNASGIALERFKF
jgi:hypothetical protein